MMKSFGYNHQCLLSNKCFAFKYKSLELLLSRSLHYVRQLGNSSCLEVSGYKPKRNRNDKIRKEKFFCGSNQVKCFV